MSCRTAFQVAGWVLLLAIARVEAQEPFDDGFWATYAKPVAMTTADFNLDGKLDYAAANGFYSNVSIALGTPGGGLSQPVTMTLSGQLVAIAAGDVDGDGKPDLAVCHGATNYGYTLLLGNGAGGFTPAVFNALSLGNLVSIEVGDITGDGTPDLIFAVNESHGAVAVCSGIGGGAFASPVTYPCGKYPRRVAIGDVNGDGKADLVVANIYSGIGSVPGPIVSGTPYIPGTTISTLLGIGSGALGVPIPSTVGKGPADVLLRDVNGDGKVDAVTANAYAGYNAISGPKGSSWYVTPIPNTTVTIALGDGQGNFAATSETTVATSPVSLASGDYDADGKPDFIVGCSDHPKGGICLLLGNGAGGVSAVKTFLGHAPIGVAAAHVDGDSNLDVVSAESIQMGFLVSIGDGAGGFRVGSSNTMTVPGVPAHIALGDFNMDGAPDAAVANYFSPGVLLGTGSGTFVASSLVLPQGGAADLASADINADGILDLAVATGFASPASIGLSVDAGVGDGTFTPLAVLDTTAHVAVAAGDLNGDGLPDIVSDSAASPFPIFVFLNSNGTTFSPPSAYGSAWSAHRIRIADLNGDGVPDLVVSLKNLPLEIFFGIGGGQFGPAMSVSGANQCGGLDVADLDGDGDLDVAAVCDVGDVLYQILMTGPGPVPQVSQFLALGGAENLVATDLDLDGRCDIALSSFTWSTVRLYFADGSGGYTRTSLSSTTALGIAAGDLDGDGASDLVIGNAHVALVTSFMNQLGFPQGTSHYGLGTFGCAGRLGMAGGSTPTVGNANFGLVCSNAPRDSLGIVFLGDAKNIPGADYFGIGALVHIDPFASIYLAGLDIHSDRGGTAFVKFPIPNDPLVLGFQLNAQCFWVEDAANFGHCGPSPFGLVSSSGLHFQVQ